MKYECYKCLWTTPIKTKMVSHLGRTRPCKINNIINLEDYDEYILKGLSYKDYLEYQSKISQKTIVGQQKNNKKTTKGEYKCVFCEKILSYKQSYYKHLKTCKEKKKDDEVKESMTELVTLLNIQLQEQNKQLQEQNNQLKDFKNEISKRDKELLKRDGQIDELIKKAGISNSTINVQNNIKLLSYSDTDRSHLTDKDILKCLKHSNFCVPYLIEKVHFDADKPENHNVYISNLKNKYVMMYDGAQWNCKDREEEISNLFDDNQGVIEHKLEECIDNGKKYPDAMRKFNRYIEKKDNDKVVNKVKDEIKLLLFNKRTVVKNNTIK